MTIFGESAGGESVSVLVSVPGPDVAADGALGRPAVLAMGTFISKTWIQGWPYSAQNQMVES